MSPTLGWIVLIVALGAFAAMTLLGVRRRRANGLTAPPTGVTLLTIGIAAAGGIVLVLICNQNRGNGLTSLAACRGWSRSWPSYCSSTPGC